LPSGLKIMRKSDPYEMLLDSAFGYISLRPRSRREVQEFLQKKAKAKAISMEIVEKVLSRLEELEYINDRKFAEMAIAASLYGKPKGPGAIAFALQQKGVSEEIISDLLHKTQEFKDEEMQRFFARKALGKKGASYRQLPVLECKRKVHDYLLRRGFSARVIHKLIDEYCKKTYNTDKQTNV